MDMERNQLGSNMEIDRTETNGSADDMGKSLDDEYRKFVKKREVLARLENTATPEQVASFSLTLLEGLTQFREKVSSAEYFNSESKEKYLNDVDQLIETAGDQHEIYSLIPSAKAAEGQRKDDPLRMSRLKVKSFDGDYKSWKSWYEQYLTAIHNNEAYKNPQVKFMYLLECLTNEPLELVSGFEVTAENYPKALAALEERYSNPQLTYVAYRKELEAMVPANDSVASLHTTVNRIRSILSNLRSYGIEEAEDDLRSLVVQKFSKALVIEAYSFAKLQHACRTEDLLQALGDRIALREWVETLRVGKRSSEIQPMSTTALVAGTSSGSSGQTGGGKTRPRKRNSCEYCGGLHKTIDCRRYATTRQRREFLNMERRCFVCLGNGHLSMACPRREKCRQCALGYHHQSICTDRQESKTVPKRVGNGGGNSGGFSGGFSGGNGGSFSGGKGSGGFNGGSFSGGNCGGKGSGGFNGGNGGSFSGGFGGGKGGGGYNGGNGSGGKRQRANGAGGMNTGKANNYNTFLQTFICDINVGSRQFMVRGLLDTGSDTSYIEVGLLKRLNIELGPSRTTDVQGFGSATTTSVQVHEATVALVSRNNGWKQTVKVLATACLAGQLRVAPPPEVVADLLKSGLQYADPTLFMDEQPRVELLLGNDLYYDIVKINGNRRLDNGLVLLSSVFGWVPAGRANLEIENLSQIGNQALISTGEIKTTVEGDNNMKEINTLLRGLWDLETLGIRETEFKDVSATVIDHFRSTCRFENGRYIVCWPWKGPKKDLNIPTNYRLSVARLKGTLRSTSVELLRQCEEKFREQLQDGIIEKVTMGSCYAQHYLPYKVIQRENKLRIVYDASARTKSGRSLNDFLHAGPSLTKNLVGLLFYFRFGAYGLLADVEKAFHMVGLDESDRDVVRFLWVDDYTQPENSQITIYRFRRVPFGVVSSPFLLNMVIQELFASHITVAERENKQVLEKGRNSFYVDNLVMSVDSVSEAERVFTSLTTITKKAGMKLRDWTSNSQEFCKLLPTELAMTEKETVSVLGLQWNKSEDTLSLRFDPEQKVLSKRMLLSAVAQIYDPLGLVAPCVLPLKLLLQTCWVKGMLWDDPIPYHMEAQLRKLLVMREEIRTISIPRRLWTSSAVNCRFTLHVFSDASRKAYGCAVYMVKQNPRTGVTCSALMYTKQRLAPCKQQSTEFLGDKTERPRSKQARRRATRLAEQIVPMEQMEKRTIPQLELLGASIAVKTISLVLSQLREKGIRIEYTYLWTDATTILQWLHSTGVLPQFVERRLQEIRNTPNLTVRYVPTKDNPADLLTRGKSAGELQKDRLWWHGPDWLVNQEPRWPLAPCTTTSYTTTTALLTTLVVARVPPNNNLSLLSDALERRYLHWDCYVETFSKLRKVIFGKKLPKYNSVKEFKQSEIALLKALQLKYFGKEILQLSNNCQPNAQLGLFLSDDGLIRCRGRLQNADLPWETIHPILLPRKSRLIDVLLNTIHRQNLHVGAAHLLAIFREKYWIEKGRAKTNSIVKQCKWCRRVTGGPYKTPPMPALPRARVADVAAFVHIGLDCFGPFNVTQPNSTELGKAYGVIFTCLVTRAIHLELTENLSGDQFLMAFLRFSSRRGTPSFVVSDNGKNFVFAQPLVSDRTNIHEIQILDNSIRSHFKTRRIQWSFIPVLTPWYGGVYERLIKNVKIGVRKAIGSRLINFVTLQTVFCKVEDIINSRPLTYVSSEDTLLPITPNHFLRLREMGITDDIEIDLSQLTITAESLVTAVRKVNSAVKTFREAFFSQYLLALRQTHKVMHNNPRGSVSYKPTPGTAVLIKDGLIPRPRWPMGVIESVDSRGATAHIRINTMEGDEMKSQIIQRPVSRLYPFEFPHQPASQPCTNAEIKSETVNSVTPAELVREDTETVAESASLDPPRSKRRRRRH